MWVLSHWYTDCYNNVMKTEREDASSDLLPHSGCSSTSKLINLEVGYHRCNNNSEMNVRMLEDTLVHPTHRVECAVHHYNTHQ